MQSFMLKKKIKLGTKIVLFRNFWTEFGKAIVIFEISTLEFIKTEFLTIIVNFGIGFTYSKGPGSACSEGLGPGLLYNVCPERVVKNMLLLNVVRKF